MRKIEVKRNPAPSTGFETEHPIEIAGCIEGMRINLSTTEAALICSGLLEALEPAGQARDCGEIDRLLEERIARLTAQQRVSGPVPMETVQSLVAKASALGVFLETWNSGDLLSDIATSLGCAECEALAKMLEAHGYAIEADILRESHCLGDEDGDMEEHLQRKMKVEAEEQERLDAERNP
jgi:hypothetical protein